MSKLLIKILLILSLVSPAVSYASMFSCLQQLYNKAYSSIAEKKKSHPRNMQNASHEESIPAFPSASVVQPLTKELDETAALPLNTMIQQLQFSLTSNAKSVTEEISKNIKDIDQLSEIFLSKWDQLNDIQREFIIKRSKQLFLKKDWIKLEEELKNLQKVDLPVSVDDLISSRNLRYQNKSMQELEEIFLDKKQAEINKIVALKLYLDRAGAKSYIIKTGDYYGRPYYALRVVSFSTDHPIAKQMNELTELKGNDYVINIDFDRKFYQSNNPQTVETKKRPIIYDNDSFTIDYNLDHLLKELKTQQRLKEIDVKYFDQLRYVDDIPGNLDNTLLNSINSKTGQDLIEFLEKQIRNNQYDRRLTDQALLKLTKIYLEKLGVKVRVFDLNSTIDRFKNEYALEIQELPKHVYFQRLLDRVSLLKDQKQPVIIRNLFDAAGKFTFDDKRIALTPNSLIDEIKSPKGAHVFRHEMQHLFQHLKNERGDRSPYIFRFSTSDRALDDIPQIKRMLTTYIGDRGFAADELYANTRNIGSYLRSGNLTSVQNMTDHAYKIASFIAEDGDFFINHIKSISPSMLLQSLESDIKFIGHLNIGWVPKEIQPKLNQLSKLIKLESDGTKNTKEINDLSDEIKNMFIEDFQTLIDISKKLLKYKNRYSQEIHDITHRLLRSGLKKESINAIQSIYDPSHPNKEISKLMKNLQHKSLSSKQLKDLEKHLRALKDVDTLKIDTIVNDIRSVYSDQQRAEDFDKLNVIVGDLEKIVKGHNPSLPF